MTVSRGMSVAVILWLAGCGGPAAPPSAVQTDSPETYLSQLRDPAAAPNAKVEALKNLGFIGAKSPAIIDGISDVLTDKSAPVRSFAIVTLQKLGGKSAVPTLKKLAKSDPDVKVRDAASAAIETLESLP